MAGKRGAGHGPKIRHKPWRPPENAWTAPVPGEPTILDMPAPLERPRAYPYVRVSTERQESKSSPETQRTTLKAYYDWSLATTHTLMPFVEDTISGNTPFLKRPGGQRLAELLRPGDAVLFSKLDRGFRNMRDMVNTVADWEERGAHCHFLDLHMDTSTPTGKFMFHILGAVADFERSRIRERMAEGHLRALAEGRPRGEAPWGFYIAGKRPRRYLARNSHERDLGARVVDMVDVQGLSLTRTWEILRDEGVRTPRSKKNYNESIGERNVRNIYHNERALRDQERWHRIAAELVPAHVRRSMKHRD